MGASSLDLPDLEQAEMDASVSGSPQPQRKTGLSVLRMLLDFMGPPYRGPRDPLGEKSLLYSAELLFLLLLGNVGTRSFRGCGIWLWISAESRNFLGLTCGQVLCVAQ